MLYCLECEDEKDFQPYICGSTGSADASGECNKKPKEKGKLC